MRPGIFFRVSWHLCSESVGERGVELKIGRGGGSYFVCVKHRQPFPWSWWKDLLTSNLNSLMHSTSDTYREESEWFLLLPNSYPLLQSLLVANLFCSAARLNLLKTQIKWLLVAYWKKSARFLGPTIHQNLQSGFNPPFQIHCPYVSSSSTNVYQMPGITEGDKDHCKIPDLMWGREI